MLTLQEAQTGVLDASTDASASNFLDREKAILGEDANQFESVGDDLIGDDSLLGGDAIPRHLEPTLRSRHNSRHLQQCQRGRLLRIYHALTSPLSFSLVSNPMVPRTLDPAAPSPARQ